MKRPPLPPIHANGLCTGNGGYHSFPCDHALPDAAQVVLCRAWLRRWALPRKSINTRISSYGLKHAVEGANRSIGLSVYIGNGAFILAAQLEGYRVVEAGGPNTFFYMRIRKLPLPMFRFEAVQA